MLNRHIKSQTVISFSRLLPLSIFSTDSTRMGSVMKLTICTLLLALALSQTSQGIPHGLSKRGQRLQCQDDYRNCPDGSEYHDEIFSSIIRALVDKRNSIEKRNFLEKQNLAPLLRRLESNRRRSSNDLEYSDY